MERSSDKDVPGSGVMDIKFVSYDEGIDKAYYIRKAVFIEEQGVPPEEEIDEHDRRATHILVFDKGVPVGTGRLFKEKERWYIGRVAVLRESRGKGIGRLIMEKLTAFARDHGAKRIFVHAQISVMDFYRNLGFTEQGAKFMDAGIPHKEMFREL
jgi:predicted GNAT family N-acyltransferase